MSPSARVFCVMGSSMKRSAYLTVRQIGQYAGFGGWL
jgi:hypothetical protein